MSRTWKIQSLGTLCLGTSSFHVIWSSIYCDIEIMSIFHSHRSLASWPAVALFLHLSLLQTPHTRHLLHLRYTNICATQCNVIINKVTLNEHNILCVQKTNLTLQDTVCNKVEHGTDLAYTSTFNS